jgi:exosortase/archaeosortase family protein
MTKLRSIRTALFVVALLLPTVYVIAANYYGINATISNLASQYISPTYVRAFGTYIGLQQRNIAASQLTISFEYLVFAAFFCLMILLAYGIKTLTDFSLSITFLGIFGLLFILGQLYPTNLTPLLIFVPVTATLAAKVLTLMGYHTILYFTTSMTSMPLLIATNRNGQSFAANIDWTCAGVESLLIYTVLILLFLRKTIIPWKLKIIYFAIGAAVTYFINTLRIAYLFILGIEYGGNSAVWQNFHNYYAMLYSIGWIVSYPLIIIGSQALWGKIKHKNAYAN